MLKKDSDMCEMLEGIGNWIAQTYSFLETTGTGRRKLLSGYNDIKQRQRYVLNAGRQRGGGTGFYRQVHILKLLELEEKWAVDIMMSKENSDIGVKF